MQNCRTGHSCREGCNVLRGVWPLMAEGYRLLGPIVTCIGVDGGVMIVQWIVMGAGHSLHSMIVQVCCEIVDMYHLPPSPVRFLHPLRAKYPHPPPRHG